MTNQVWVDVCDASVLTDDTGLCAKLDDEQVAIFKLAGSEKLFAVSNFDPFGKANVLSRGIVGSIGEKLVVASPLYKQHFDLQTGECLEDADVFLKIYSARIADNKIQLSA
jgi:nitrite reductase (NADH) small subunit